MHDTFMKTDHQLQHDVLEELGWEPSVDAAHIGVSVRDGVVTLSGHVNSLATKAAAERATQRVPGVKALAVEMDVRLTGANLRADADIARAAEGVLQWMPSSARDSVKVVVEAGWITLSGEVGWHYQKITATHCVRLLRGVKGVSDQISIRPARLPHTIKSDIEAALARRAKADIVVAVKDRDVTLSGKVRSWAERELASESAWGTHGVSSVINNITVAA